MTKIGKFYVIKKIVGDVACIILLSVGLVMVNFFMVPPNRGFFCNDESLMHPYIKNTVFSSSTVIIMGFVFLFVIVIGEIFYERKSKKQPLKLFNFQIPNWISCSCHNAGPYVAGALSTLLVSDVLKRSTGRLRPYFITMCAPNINCTLPINHNKYFSPNEFNCTSSYDHSVKTKVRLSFPSNHAACITYFGVYLICYLQLRMTRSCVIPKYLLQVSLVLMISYISMTRILDYRHHWSDVAAGILIGFVNALITVFIVAGLFKELKPEKIEPETERVLDQLVIGDCNNNPINVMPKIDVEMII